MRAICVLLPLLKTFDSIRSIPHILLLWFRVSLLSRQKK